MHCTTEMLDLQEGDQWQVNDMLKLWLQLNHFGPGKSASSDSLKLPSCGGANLWGSPRGHGCSRGDTL